MLKKYGLLLVIVGIIGILFILSSLEDKPSFLRIEKGPPPEIRYELWIDTKACYEEDLKKVQEALKGREYLSIQLCDHWIDKWFGLGMEEGAHFYIPGMVDIKHILGTEEEKRLLSIQSKYSWMAVKYSYALLRQPKDIEEINQTREEYEQAKKEIDNVFYWY